MSNSVDQKEIETFSKDSSHWWDVDGPFKPLHRLNPVRISYIKEQICDHFGREFKDLNALKSLKILDIGCGGGLVCEPLARLGATVTGVDADESAITVAQEHAEEQGLTIDYKASAVEDLKEQYDVVLALEIVEHVSDVPFFIESCIKRLKPGGLIIFSTLNKTAKSYAFGIVAAEYILRWVPRGTHDWQKFIKPSTLSRHLRNNQVTVKGVKGLIFNPIKNEFRMSESDLDVNYFITGILPKN